MKQINNITSNLKRNTIIIATAGSVTILALFSAVLMSDLPVFVKYIVFTPALLIPFIPLLPAGRQINKIRDRVSKDSVMFRMGQKRVSYLENIIQNSTDIIFTLDSALLILRFNKGAEYHSGYSQEEILGKPITTIFENKDQISEFIEEARNSGSVINKEIVLTTKEGHQKDLNISLSEMNYGNTSINGFVITAKDVTDKKKLEQELKTKNTQLKKLAITDSLTQLYNVRHFRTQLSGELKRLRRNPGRDLSLLMIDVDHFKELNDTEGHQVGDDLLRSLAQVIKACIREDIDTGFRYGGDEFVLILPDTDKDQAIVVAERIQKQFSAFKFGKTSLSIGITDAQKNDDEEGLIKRADEAMYISKKAGKGRATSL